jgi:hypothetical protein
MERSLEQLRTEAAAEVLAELNIVCRIAHRRMVAAQDRFGVDSDEARAAETDYDLATERRAELEARWI